MSLLKFYFSDLLKARNKCKKAESDSELLTDAGEQNLRRKRKTHPIQRSSDSENDDEDCYTGIKFPSPPQKNLKQKLNPTVPEA